MSFFDEKLIISPINRNGQYLPLYQWSSLIGAHYLEAQQIIQREAPWAIIYTVVNDHQTTKKNHRSEGINGISFRNDLSPAGYCESNVDLDSECCKPGQTYSTAQHPRDPRIYNSCNTRKLRDPLKTPDCFKLNYKELGLSETPDFNRICIFYDRQTGLVNHIPIRG